MLALNQWVQKKNRFNFFPFVIKKSLKKFSTVFLINDFQANSGSDSSSDEEKESESNEVKISFIKVAFKAQSNSFRNTFWKSVHIWSEM